MAFRWKPQDLSYEQYQFLQDPNNAFKNRANTKQAQSMLGFEGTDVDGKIGPATRNAYNSQMPYYSDLYGKVDKAGALDLNDPNAFYEDMHAAETYGFTPQEAEESLNADIQQEQAEQEAVAKQQKIANIQSQIKALETRIAENQAKLKNWNGGDVANKVAALEARKFFSQDPTSIWRWKVDRDEARRLANEQKNTSDNVVRANALFEIQNDLDSIIVDDKMTSQDQKAYLSKLSNLKTLAQKNSLPTDAIDKKIKEVKGETEQPTQEKPESVAEEDFDFEGGPRDVGEARATKILQKDPEKLTQNELAALKRDIVSGKISVSNETKNKIDKIYSQVIDRDKKKNEAIKKAKSLVGKKNPSSKDIEFMSGMKGFKKKSDDYGNIWFEEVL